MKFSRPRLLFVTVLLLVYGTLALQPEIMGAFGVAKLGPWFRDAYAMLAASDSAQAGYNPFVENPYDLIGERHIYPDWWFVLGAAGLDRSDHIAFGLGIVLMFWLAVFWVLPLATIRQAWVAVGICASPPFWLAFNRGNPDLLMFALLTLTAGLVLSGGRWCGRLALLPLILAVGLKYYPVLGAVVLLWPAVTARERVIRLGLAALALGWVGWTLRDAIANYLAVGWLARGQLVFGAAALPMKAGLDGAACAQLGRIVGAALVAWAALQTRHEPVSIDHGNKPALLFVLGVALLAGNFFLTVGFLYKIIFAVWLLPAFLVWAEGDGPHRRFARFWLGTLLALVWFVPLVCVVSPLWLEWLGPAWEAPVRRTTAAMADALTWVVVVPVLWLAVPMMRALVPGLWRKEAA